MKLTPWFNIENVPSRPGVYEVNCGDLDIPLPSPWHYFNGRGWGAPRQQKHEAETVNSFERPNEFYLGVNSVWRGLASRDGK